MKKILMIAFHYPPCQGASGIQRTLKFSRYLPRYGWQPVILSAHPRTYSLIGNEQLHEIPVNVPVRRAFAMDTARHLSIRGLYMRLMALPDRWVSWWLGAVPAGLHLIRRYRPNYIWSTFPIATAHLIGLTLHLMTSIPWLADFRDSMTEQDYPPIRSTRMVYRWLECLALRYCTCAVFTTPGAVRMYSERYPEIPRSRFAIIENGYGEEDFAAVEQSLGDRTPPAERVVLVHSGLLYPSERDPTAFFAALAELRQTRKISPANLKIILRGSGSEDLYLRQLKEKGIDDIVFLEPPLPYLDAISEMVAADGLLLFQASNCNHQIPAKIYEYLRAQRPILALTDTAGDTAGLLKSAGLGTIVPLDSKEGIMWGLSSFLTLVRGGCAPVARDELIRVHSRESRTRELVKVLERSE